MFVLWHLARQMLVKGMFAREWPQSRTHPNGFVLVTQKQ